MIEEIYQLYKTLRDLADDMEKNKSILTEPALRFLGSTQCTCNSYDDVNRDFFNRWMKENDKNEHRKT